MDPHDEVGLYAAEHFASIFPEIPKEARPRLVELVLKALSSPGSSSRDLASWLFEELAYLNLDWRLVAVSALGECYCQGFVASRPLGSKVRWKAPYSGGCDCCRELDGRVFTVVAADAPDRDWSPKFGGASHGLARRRSQTRLREIGPPQACNITAADVRGATRRTAARC